LFSPESLENKEFTATAATTAAAAATARTTSAISSTTATAAAIYGVPATAAATAAATTPLHGHKDVKASLQLATGNWQRATCNGQLAMCNWQRRTPGTMLLLDIGKWSGGKSRG